MSAKRKRKITIVSVLAPGHRHRRRRLPSRPTARTRSRPNRRSRPARPRSATSRSRSPKSARSSRKSRSRSSRPSPARSSRSCIATATSCAAAPCWRASSPTSTRPSRWPTPRTPSPRPRSASGTPRRTSRTTTSSSRRACSRRRSIATSRPSTSKRARTTNATREKYTLVEKSGIPIGQSAANFQRLEHRRADGRRRAHQERRDRRVHHLRRLLLQRRHRAVHRRRHLAHDRQGRRERSRHRQDPRRPAGAASRSTPIRRSRFDGKIDRIAPAVRIDEKVRVFDVEIRLDAQGRELRSGMTANIEVIGEKKDKGPLRPGGVGLQARRSGDRVREEGHRPESLRRGVESQEEPRTDRRKSEKDAWKKFFDKRVVVTGLADNARVEIVSGLKPAKKWRWKTRPSTRRTTRITTTDRSSQLAVLSSQDTKRDGWRLTSCQLRAES